MPAKAARKPATARQPRKPLRPGARRTHRIKIGAKRQITLPQRALSAARAREGDYVEINVREEDGVIELIPLAMIPRDQLWYWTKEWQAGERKVDEHIRAGRVKRFDNIDDLIGSLKS